MPRERILVTVKTYPTLSRTYGETVCTAGVREDGSWVRIYPVPFRRLNLKQQYAKYDWLEGDLKRNGSDPRPETYRPTDLRQMVPAGHMDTRYNWRQRRRLILGKCRVYTRLSELIEDARANRASLAVFKPSRVTGFIPEPDEREWDAAKLDAMRQQAAQGQLFPEDAWRQTFRVLPKLPYSFSYRIEDADGRSSTMQILDWEIGALYWSCMRTAHGDEAVALEKVRRKYQDQFLEADLHLFLGTTLQFHFVAPNPWVIVGVFPIPLELQPELL